MLAFLLWLGSVVLLGEAALRRGPRELGAARAASACPGQAMGRPVAVERRGLGVECLSEEEARSERVEAGDAVRTDGDAKRGRMAPARLELFMVPIDPNQATAAELASLPGIGPGLAAHIVAARARRPFTDLASLGAVRGIGPKKLARMKARLLFGEPAVGHSN